jgi:hypothetical protein
MKKQLHLGSLLSDTKIGKDVSEQIVGSDFSRDFAEVVKCLSDVNGDEV